MLTSGPWSRGRPSITTSRPTPRRSRRASTSRKSTRPATSSATARGRSSAASSTATATGKLDQWSYYQDGFEVYREVDLDERREGRRGPLDERRRHADRGGRRPRTRSSRGSGSRPRRRARCSSRRSSTRQPRPARHRDGHAPRSSPALGVPAARGRAGRGVGEGRGPRPSRGSARGSSAGTRGRPGSGSTSPMPHVIPADASAGLKGDLTLYENAVILAGPADGAPGANTSFLQASEVVKVGDTWKFVDLPRAINPSRERPDRRDPGGHPRGHLRQRRGDGRPRSRPRPARGDQDTWPSTTTPTPTVLAGKTRRTLAALLSRAHPLSPRGREGVATSPTRRSPTQAGDRLPRQRLSDRPVSRRAQASSTRSRPRRTRSAPTPRSAGSTPTSTWRTRTRRNPVAGDRTAG